MAQVDVEKIQELYEGATTRILESFRIPDYLTRIRSTEHKLLSPLRR